MTNSKRTASLDEVLADYAHASPEFDAKVLQTFIEKYPEQAGALQRYAQIQLTSVPATAEEADSEVLSDEEMLLQQSKLLQCMQKLRGDPSASDLAHARSKLSSISGEQATRAATVAIFGSCEHGEDLLFLSVTDSPSEVQDVPGWFYERLGSHLEVPPAAIVATVASRRRPSRLLRFSTREKPAESPPITWKQAVEECITDSAIQRSILERSGCS
jgi:hypothetical protein